MTSADCGAACLAMVAGLWRKHVALDELRRELGAGPSGTDAIALLRCGHRYGLRGRGVRAEPDELECLPMGAVLHWEFNHFVVLERVHRDAVVIVDPAVGRRRLSRQRFVEGFTGVALLFEPAEGFEPGPPRPSIARRYLARVLAHSHLWRRIVVLSAALQIFALGLPLVTAVLVDRVVPRSDVELLAVLAAGSGLVVAFGFLTSLVRSNLLVQLRTLIDAETTFGFVDHLLRLPFAFFQQRSAGDLVMRLQSHATVREILTSSALSGLLDGTLVIVYLLVIGLLSPVLGLVVVGLAAAQIGIYVGTRRRQRELMSEGLAAQARTSSFEVEMLGGVETIKSMGAEPRVLERWSNLFTDHLNVSLERARLDATVGASLAAFAMAAPLCILGTGAMLVLRHELTLGAMLGLGALGVGFLGPLGALVNTALKLQLLGSYLDRIEDVLASVPEPNDPPKMACPPLRGRIVAHQLSFRYREDGPWAVRDVSLEVEPGRFVAIVGPSGAGKSTLAKLLVGLHLPSAGTLAYDGFDLRTLDLTSLRQRFGVVTQHAALFAMSIRDNIALGRSVPFEQVVRATRIACIDRDIVALPLGYDTMLADGGASLSGGQRQRLALARALVGEPSIVLLDEATSALDSETERAVAASLAELRCTRIAIAHRMSTVKGADLIVVMEGGRVVETGTHEQLLRRGGTYRRLCEDQLSRSSA